MLDSQWETYLIISFWQRISNISANLHDFSKDERIPGNYIISQVILIGMLGTMQDLSNFATGAQLSQRLISNSWRYGLLSSNNIDIILESRATWWIEGNTKQSSRESFPNTAFYTSPVIFYEYILPFLVRLSQYSLADTGVLSQKRVLKKNNPRHIRRFFHSADCG